VGFWWGGCSLTVTTTLPFPRHPNGVAPRARAHDSPRLRPEPLLPGSQGSQARKGLPGTLPRGQQIPFSPRELQPAAPPWVFPVVFFLFFFFFFPAPGVPPPSPFVFIPNLGLKRPNNCPPPDSVGFPALPILSSVWPPARSHGWSPPQMPWALGCSGMAAFQARIQRQAIELGLAPRSFSRRSSPLACREVDFVGRMPMSFVPAQPPRRVPETSSRIAPPPPPHPPPPRVRRAPVVANDTG